MTVNDERYIEILAEAWPGIPAKFWEELQAVRGSHALKSVAFHAAGTDDQERRLTVRGIKELVEKHSWSWYLYTPGFYPENLPADLKADWDREQATETLQELSDYSGDIEPIRPPAMLTGDGIALMYAGRRHIISADKDTGKTTFASLAAAQELLKGNYVLWLDYERQKDQVAERLITLGVPENIVRTNWIHKEAPTAEGLSEIAETIATFNELEDGPKVTLAVVDTVRQLSSAVDSSIRDNMGHDVTATEREVFNPLQDAGVAVLILAHLSSGSAFGSQHWENTSDVVMIMRPAVKFGRDKDGHSTIHVVRDRFGYLPAETHVANLSVEECVPELVLPEGTRKSDGPKGKGTLLCGTCGNPKKDKRAENCKGCSNRAIAKERDDKAA